MRTLLLIGLAALPAAAAALAEGKLDTSMGAKLGRPYVWGASGLKSYDCSGFVWRSLRDAGVLLKRTTARKMFFSLAPAEGPERARLGTLVFFDEVHHVGVVVNEREFYHASSSHGTRRDHFQPYWVRFVSGYRKLN